MKKLTLLLIAAVLVSGCSQKGVVMDQNSEKVVFTTSDGFEIAGTYLDAAGESAVILLHMLNGDRSQWQDFPLKLRQNGYSVLAIDIRGHGESVSKDGKIVRWNSFSDKDFNDAVKDISAAKSFLKNKGKSKIAIIGASIGGNIAVNYAAGDSDIAALVLLSPGLDYHGVLTEDAVAAYGNRPVLLVAGKDDSYSYTSVQRLSDAAGSSKEIKIYDNAGHGTNMMIGTDLADVMIGWVGKKVQAKV